jgi:hypothetical protein
MIFNLNPKKESYYLFGITFFGLLLRVLFTDIDGLVSSNGGAQYLELARNLSNGHGYIDINGYPELLDTPFFPILLSSLSFLFNNFITSAEYFVLFTNTLLIPLTYLLGKKLYGTKTAIISSVLVSFYPELMRYSGLVLSESIYTFLIILCAVSFYRAIETNNTTTFALCGSLFGITYLSKPIFFIYFVSASTIFLFYAIYSYGDTFLSGLLKLSTFTSCFLIFAVPFVVYIYGETGDVSISQKSVYNIHIGGKKGLEYEKSIAGLYKDNYTTNRRAILEGKKGTAVSYILNNLRSVSQRYVENMGKLYLRHFSSAIYPLFIILIGLGLFGSRQIYTDFKSDLVMIMFVVIPIFITPIFFSKSRFLIPLAPFFLTWSSRGILQLSSCTHNKIYGCRNFDNKMYVICSSILLLIFVSTVPILIKQGPFGAGGVGTKKSILEASSWVKKNTSSNDKIMTRSNHVPFYSNRTGVLIPFCSLSKLKQFAINNDADFLLLYEPNITSTRPNLSFLLDRNKKPPKWLHKVYTNTNNDKIVIYNIEMLNRFDNT